MKKYLLRFLSIISLLFVGTSNALEYVGFQKTVADVSFKDRAEVLQEGYEPFKDTKSYYQIHVEQTEKNSTSTTNRSGAGNSGGAGQNDWGDNFSYVSENEEEDNNSQENDENTEQRDQGDNSSGDSGNEEEDNNSQEIDENTEQRDQGDNSSDDSENEEEDNNSHQQVSNATSSENAPVQNLSSITNKPDVGNGDSNDSDKNESVMSRVRVISSEEVQERIKPNWATSKENNQDGNFSQASELEGDKYKHPQINIDSDKSRDTPTIEGDSAVSGVPISIDIPWMTGIIGSFSINMDCTGVIEKFNTSQIEGFAFCKDLLGGNTGQNCWCSIKDPKSSVLQNIPAYAIKTFNSYGECSEKCTDSCNSLYKQELLKLCTDN